jgi:diguanylate cyclase (GGDEF)-like protein
MTTTNRLNLMLTITILFGLIALFSIMKLSKAVQLHHLNFLQSQHVTELSKELINYPKFPLVTKTIINNLETIRIQSVACINLLNEVDKFIMRLIGVGSATSLCDKNKSLIELLLQGLQAYKAPMIVDPVYIDSLNHAIKVLRINSEQFGIQIGKLSKFTSRLVIWLFFPFTCFIIITSIYIFRKLKIKSACAKNAIAALEKSQKEKEKLAYYDSLTTLPNRNLFTELLKHKINQVKRYNASFALLFIDLDRFKSVNDTLGHDAGDELIIQVSKRLKKCLRESDTLARFGGDEFLLILSGQNSDKHVHIVASKIVEAVAKPYAIGGNEIHVSASVGICFCPKNGLDSSTLLKRADIAMYEAKRNGKNQYHIFINNKSENRIHLEKDLRHAIEYDELLLHYQPVININNFNIAGVEALIRWQHHTKGMISPDEFIPISEETGMIHEIGNWVINQSCKQCKTWRESGRPDFHIAVNVSAFQLKNYKFPMYINDVLSHYSLPSDAIYIEITESAFYSEDKKSLENLNQLSEMGMHLLLDDFGTGYSSLSTLHGLPFNTIKIDRAFMDVSHPKKRIITQTIIDMAKNFDMEIVAEGVEDQDAVDFLSNLGCQFAQGYFFQKPIPADELNTSKNYKQTPSISNITAIGNKKNIL